MSDRSSSHVIDELGLHHWIEDGLSRGRADILPSMLVPGTGFVRIGVLTILADLVAGQPATGPVNPTTDIDVHVVRPRPMTSVSLTSRVLKAGRTLVVIETLLMADDESEPFATSLATFMNRPIPEGTAGTRNRSGAVALAEPMHLRMGVRTVRPGTVELDARADVTNGFYGTIQGGLTATLAELAAESASGEEGPVLVNELDVRFLSRVTRGPARAVAQTLTAGPYERAFAVTVSDVGDEDRVVAYASARSAPAARFI